MEDFELMDFDDEVTVDPDEQFKQHIAPLSPDNARLQLLLRAIGVRTLLRPARHRCDPPRSRQ
jgi:hypothetical protein